MNLDRVGKIIEDILEEGVNVGFMNRSVREGIGVYWRHGGMAYRGIVGLEPSSYDIFGISILMRLGTDVLRADKRAREIYEKLISSDTLQPLYNAPVWLGADNTGVYECVIDLDLLCRKDENFVA